jgi:hypothetical protein
MRRHRIGNGRRVNGEWRNRKRRRRRGAGLEPGGGARGGRSLRPRIRINPRIGEKFIKYCFTWIRFFLQCCAIAVFRTTFREGLCTDMAESFSSSCETGSPVRQLLSAVRRAPVVLETGFRNGRQALRAGCRRARLFSVRLSPRFSVPPLAAGHPSRRFLLWNRSDRFRHARMIWSSSRLAVCRCALQRLAGGVLPPQ